MVASIRDLYVQRAQAAIDNRKNLAEAYIEHLKAVTDVLKKPAAKSSGGTKGGTLGEGA